MDGAKHSRTLERWLACLFRAARKACVDPQFAINLEGSRPTDTLAESMDRRMCKVAYAIRLGV
jgi:hypothetical protein